MKQRHYVLPDSGKARKARLDAGLTQLDVAERLQASLNAQVLSQPTISQIERRSQIPD